MSADAPVLYYFEDYHEGFEISGGAYTVTEEEIREFGARFDPQPFHNDPEAARASHFGGLIAPGCLTFCIRTALMNQIGGRPALIAGLGVEQMELENPVRPGHVLSLCVSVIDRRLSKSKPDRGVVTLRHRVDNDAGETVLSMVAKMLVACRPEEA